ncbi:MAG: hypothetical protein WCK63_13310 [Betaproteobacteria bacterium]
MLLAFSFAFFIPVLAHSANETTENSDAGKPFANVWRLKGELAVTDPHGDIRHVRKDGPVFVGEKVRAGLGSEAVLQTRDAGLVAVRPGSEFVAERFAAEGKKTDHQILRLISGSLRIISGWIGQLNNSEHRVLTPNATIGIRGTDHEPYLLPATEASALYPQGTYDKVNRGATLLDANGGNIGIDSGKVGFARDPSSTEVKTRALMTILLPVVLDKIPGFYVPGAFDGELDQYSLSADSRAKKQLEKLTGSSTAEPTPLPSPTQHITTAEADIPEPPQPLIVGCPPLTIGKAWLGRFDRAIARRDIKTILALFAPDIVAQATVQTSGGATTTLEFKRDEMVQSTLSSIASLKNYQQRRMTIEAALAEGETVKTCQRITVKSITIEQGLMSGKTFRFEALEDYLLEQQNGEWLAIKAHTTQR